MPVIETKKEAVETAKAVEIAKISKEGEESKGEYLNLARILCIRYPITFRKKSMSLLFDLNSKVNAINPTLAQKLGLPIRPTDIGAQKIDGIIQNIYKMVVIAFSMTDKAN